ADKPGRRRKPDGFCDCFRIIPKAVLKIGAHRQIGGCDDCGDMLNHLVAANRIIPLPSGKLVSGAGSRQRIKAEVCKQPCRTNIPWIGNDKCACSLVKCPKSAPFLGLSSHPIPPQESV